MQATRHRVCSGLTALISKIVLVVVLVLDQEYDTEADEITSAATGVPTPASLRQRHGHSAFGLALVRSFHESKHLQGIFSADRRDTSLKEFDDLH